MNGIECLLEISSNYANEDDVVGGAVITGSVVGEVMGRIEGVPLEMLLLNQGIETGQQYMATCLTGVTVRNNYNVRVKWPTDHFLYDIPLRVLGVTRTSGRGPFAHLELLLRHIDEST